MYILRDIYDEIRMFRTINVENREVTIKLWRSKYI